MKNALIIGASGGIGNVISRGLFEQGWNLSVTGTQRSKLDSQFKDLMIQDESRIRYFELNFKKECAPALETMRAHLPTPDLIVNAAGIHHQGNWDLAEDKFRDMLEINVMGPFRVVKTFLPEIIKKGKGTIINISSRRGRIATPGEGAYSTSKFALNGLGEALYKELAPQGIKVTTLCPGWVHTPMANRAPLSPDQMIQATDILKAILFIENLSPAARIKEIIMEPSQHISA